MEVSARSRFNTIAAATIRCFVEVEVQNLIFVVHTLDLNREDHLLDLAWYTIEAAFFDFALLEEGLLDELLCQC